MNPYTTYADKTAAIVRIEADNAALLAQVRTLRAQLEGAAFDLERAHGELATAKRALAQAEAAAGWSLLDADAADELNDTGLSNRETDAALRAYANGATTTYTPVGERLVLDKLPY